MDKYRFNILGSENVLGHNIVVIDLIDKDIIKILTGVRRSGKSVLLQQVVNHLKNNGIKEENIIFIDLESPDFLSYSTINDLNEYIKSKSNKTDKYYLFFDEIQRIEGWQRLVNAYFSLDNFDGYGFKWFFKT